MAVDLDDAVGGARAWLMIHAGALADRALLATGRWRQGVG